MAKNKRLAAARAKVVATQAYGLDDAVPLAMGNGTAKSDETIVMALNLGIDPRRADQRVRGVFLLPHKVKTIGSKFILPSG